MGFKTVSLGLEGPFGGMLPESIALDEVEYTLTGLTPDLDPDLGTIQTWVLEGNSTPVDTLTAGQSMTLRIADGTAYYITWPSVVWIDGEAPELATTGYTVVILFKIGSTLYGSVSGEVAS